MGFSLGLFFEKLNEALNKEQKTAKTVKELRKIIESNEAYAKQCGFLDN